MLNWYANWIANWEAQLATRDNNRVVRRFEWGSEWLTGQHANGSSAEVVDRAVAEALADSDRFYGYQTPADFRLDNGVLKFTSPVHTPYPENNTVYADYFPAPNHRGKAVLVLPQWNSDAMGHVGLCKLINRFGFSALRMSKAYHDRRMPAELERADYHVSSNIGRTIHASRQSVIDARSCLDWLQSQGYRRLAILGTSLGSCVAFITAAHDRRIELGVFNHVSMYFSDVVWTGISTKHVRQGFEGEISQEQLRRYWSVISPASFLERLHGRDMRSLLIWARHDSSFLPVYSKQVLDYFKNNRLPHEVYCLPCGHYTTGQTPFKFLDGFAMCRFLKKWL